MKKYFILLGLIVTLSLAAVVCANISSDAFDKSCSADLTQFRVVYVKDGQAVLTQLVEKNGKASPPEAGDLPGGRFITWCVNGEEYDFDTEIVSETVLTAVYNKRYTVTFLADGEAVKSSVYTYFNRGDVSVPCVPEKYGYSGSWEAFELDGGDKTVNAVYVPVEYTVTFLSDGTDAHIVTCTIEDYEDKIPVVPFKEGADGVWVYELQDDGTVTATARYTPKRYEITFYVEGEILLTRYCTSEDCDVDAPEIPPKDHYTAYWERTYTGGAAITVNAVYIPVIYRALFFARGVFVAEVPYTVDDKSLNEPQVPQEPYYSGCWEEYLLPYADFKINAEYTAEEYFITFVADGVAAGSLAYTVETEINSLSLPEVPKKAGFCGEWEAFGLDGGNLTVHAVYSPVSGSEGLKYARCGEGYAVTGFTGTAVDVVVPSFYNGLPVTLIAADAFSNCAIENIVICENVKTIESNAFLRCGRLKSADLPDTLVIIGENAFYCCVGLKEIIIPDNVSVIDVNAFAGCYSLESAVIGASVRQIGENAFFKCDNLKTVLFISAQGWKTLPATAEAQLIALSPQDAAKTLVEYCDRTFIKEDIA